MKKTYYIDQINIFNKCRNKANSKEITCRFPGCEKIAINSHILQKKGIVNSIAHNGHVYELSTDLFNTECLFSEKRIGINKAFSFKCFCNNHDTEIFKNIEVDNIDFAPYKNRLLFMIRTTFSELHKKEIALDTLKCILSNTTDRRMMEYCNLQIEGYLKGIKDIKKIIKEMWNDYHSSVESFVINVRKITKLPIILSSFFNYETTDEIKRYMYLNSGKQPENLSEIFICLFPYIKNSVLIIGYRKSNEIIVKSHVNQYIKENEKRLERKITNLVFMQCENWICSESLFLKRIKPNINHINDIINISFEKTSNERRVYDINLFNDQFSKKVILLKGNMGNTRG